MENKHKLALVVAYYLARFNRQGVLKLGFSSFNQAFQEIARILSIKNNYIKLRRDEFDQIFPWRRGWQRPMDRQIIRTVEAFQDLGEPDLFEIVFKILHEKQYHVSEELKEITTLLKEDKIKRKGKFILRSPTGKQAEEFFIKYFNQNKEPIDGLLIDKREFGCGYDFEVITKNHNYFIEVKGLSEVEGGILFTNKEWYTAIKSGEYYFLTIVKNINNKPTIVFIQNPASKLKAKKNIYTTVQIQWSVYDKELKRFD